MTLEERLDKIESLLVSLIERERIREYYSVEEFARIVDRAPFTVREWARHGRLNTVRKESGRGAHKSYGISHEELLRFQREGLLPIRRPAA
jgi:hypothetical protein